MKKLFTERHGAVKRQVVELLDDIARDALLRLIRARMDEEWFGLAFPDLPPYGRAGPVIPLPACRPGH